MLTNLVAIVVLRHLGDSPMWLKVMGGMFIVMAAYLMWGQQALHVRINGKTMNFFALASGLIQGAFGVGGPPMDALAMRKFVCFFMVFSGIVMLLK